MVVVDDAYYFDYDDIMLFVYDVMPKWYIYIYTYTYIVVKVV